MIAMKMELQIKVIELAINGIEAKVRKDKGISYDHATVNEGLKGEINCLFNNFMGALTFLKYTNNYFSGFNGELKVPIEKTMDELLKYWITQDFTHNTLMDVVDRGKILCIEARKTLRNTKIEGC